MLSIYKSPQYLVRSIGMTLAGGLLAMPAIAATFLSALEDIPLPKGMSETVNSVEFHSPYGRIVESTARGIATELDVQSFYSQSMPALGWQQINTQTLAFRRGEETLYLDFSRVDDQLSVHYRLVVRPAPSKMDG